MAIHGELPLQLAGLSIASEVAEVLSSKHAYFVIHRTRGRLPPDFTDPLVGTDAL